MKNSVLYILAILFSPSIFFSQSIEGYLGQRLSIGIETNPNFRFAEFGYDEDKKITSGDYYDNSYKGDIEFQSNHKYNSSIGINKRIGLNVDYVVTKKSSLSFTFSRFKTGFSSKVNLYGFHYGQNYFAYPYLGLVNTTVGLEYFAFYGENSAAPLGKYVSLGVQLVHSNITDPSSLNYGPTGLLVYNGVHLEDPKQKMNTALFSFGLGKKTMVGFDRIIVDYGIEFGLSSAFVARIKADRFNHSSFDEDYNSEYYEIDTSIKNSAKNRLLNYFPMNLHVGINILLF